MNRMICIFFGVGLLRPAPGTWGSATGLLLGWGLIGLAGFPLFALAFAALTFIALRAISAELADLPGADPAEIVIDELAGQWLALLFPAAMFWVHGAGNWLPWPALVAAFGFFRLFDIWKPGPIGRADRRGDAAGVLYDDLWAGAFAGIASLITAALAHRLLL